MRLLLIRHAESEANTLLHLVGGQVNEVPLTPKGISQATALGKRWQKENINLTEVHSSVAVRASHTCQIACEAIGYDMKNVHYTPDLVEISQGVWTGKLRTEIYTPEMLEVIRQDPFHFKPPQGESQKDVEERAWGYLEQHVFHHIQAQTPATVAIFAHGIVIKCIIKRILQSSPAMTWKINLENTAITTFLHKEQGWFLEVVNDFAHLH